MNTGAGEDNRIDHNKNRLKLPYIFIFFGPIISTRSHEARWPPCVTDDGGLIHPRVLRCVSAWLSWPACCCAASAKAGLGLDHAVPGSGGPGGSFTAPPAGAGLAALLPPGLLESSPRVAREELQAVQRCLLQHAALLWRLFRHFCDSSSTGAEAAVGMSASDYASFVKAVRWPRRMLAPPLLDALLQAAAFDQSHGAWPSPNEAHYQPPIPQGAATSVTEVC
eukprot:COSAG01_NODE_4798_length_4738_cov_3.104980_8_plen_223_part_00